MAFTMRKTKGTKRSNDTDSNQRKLLLDGKAVLCFGAMMIMLLPFVTSDPTQYAVGNEKGWTVNVNYTQWASNYTFQEGDIVVFQYPRGEHDVLRVSSNDYEACTVSNPMETDSSGQTAFELKKGENYFICGFPKHCKLSQKVFINVGDLPVVDPNGVDTLPYDSNAIGAVAQAPGPSPSDASKLSTPIIVKLTSVQIVIAVFSYFGYRLKST